MDSTQFWWSRIHGTKGRFINLTQPHPFMVSDSVWFSPNLLTTLLTKQECQHFLGFEIALNSAGPLPNCMLPFNKYLSNASTQEGREKETRSPGVRAKNTHELYIQNGTPIVLEHKFSVCLVGSKHCSLTNTRTGQVSLGRSIP